MEYFQEISNGVVETSHSETRKFFKGYTAKSSPQGNQASDNVQTFEDQSKILKLINSYRLHGHMHALLDPLRLAKRKTLPDLDINTYDFNGRIDHITIDFETDFIAKGSSLKDVYAALCKTYADTVGVEYLHISDNEKTKWIQSRLENVRSHPKLSKDTKQFILEQLTETEGLERYLGTKYVGQKRFSLEGADVLIPALNSLINDAGGQDVKEIIIGMAHRGRLNVLVNVLGKSPESLFEEFEGKIQQEITGDVKYHMGYSADVKVSTGQIVHLGLTFNPSHLEIISPVVEGSVRARQKRIDDLGGHGAVIPVLIHGDAAIAGQGVVMETMNFSKARGYATGGTIHIIINNQIGFTMSNPLNSRSTLYCSDIDKMIQAPIFHVNSDDPEAVIFVTKLALDFRMKFNQDVVIDLVSYRRHGHNEADEPSVTQPNMYHAIKKLDSAREKYANSLVEEELFDQSFIDKLVSDCRDQLDSGKIVVKNLVEAYRDDKALNWEPFLNKSWNEVVDTSISSKSIDKLCKELAVLPNGFKLHPVVSRIMKERQKMSSKEIDMNWGFAENLAYASILSEGYGVRISGQDCGRGTFAHRHAVLHDQSTGEEYTPLKNISEQFIIIDSILSEEAVLGFEYGLALAEPNSLVIWEAQFGDFVNGAQVVIDQFICSGEQKWGRLCGLVMFLPHGFEGQGPEHSSARMQRFLQLSAQNNIQVCVPTTPAQTFHMLRRQMLRPYRKPLIVFTPKSLLRHKLAVSTMDDLTSGKFELIINEHDILPDNTTKLIFCTGKVYYELLQKRIELGIKDVALVRIEQLYPFPEEALTSLMKSYAHVTDIVWTQEEPKNQGAWQVIQEDIKSFLSAKQRLSYVGRIRSAAPAEGSAKAHKKIQERILMEALTGQ